MKFIILLFITLTVFSCSPNNVTIEPSIGNIFKEYNVDGCFALFNNNSGQFTVYNLKRYKDSAFLPASTFKIINSLIGLQKGVISNDSMVIRWDKKVRPIEAWNKDLSMYEAFRVSAVPYFQQVARWIGKDTMQHWLDSLSYGTKKIKSKIDTFWLDNTLKITPDEQLGLVKKLYFNELPFNRLNQEIVKRAMLFEDKPLYKLSYKTGLGYKENGNLLGWVVGYIQENNHPYFFVLNMESADKNVTISDFRIKMLKEILISLGFLKGKK